MPRRNKIWSNNFSPETSNEQFSKPENTTTTENEKIIK